MTSPGVTENIAETLEGHLLLTGAEVRSIVTFHTLFFAILGEKYNTST